jgi:hypothetical protein
MESVRCPEIRHAPDLWHAGSAHIPNGGPAQIMESEVRHALDAFERWCGRRVVRAGNWLTLDQA